MIFLTSEIAEVDVTDDGEVIGSGASVVGEARGLRGELISTGVLSGRPPNGAFKV
jgi:hypothetical protein